MRTIYEVANDFHDTVGFGDEGTERVQEWLGSLPRDVRKLLADETGVWAELARESWQKSQTYPDKREAIELILDLYGDREREVQKHFDYSTLPTE